MRKIYIILAILLVLIITQVTLEHRQLVKQSVPIPVLAQPVATTSNSIPANVEPTAYKDNGDDKNGMHIGFIKDVSTDFIGLDYIQWIACKDCDDDYQIKNDSTQVHRLPIAPSTNISLQTYAYDPEGGLEWNQLVSLEEFIQIYLDKKDQYPADKLLYWVTIKDGKVIDISEQYQP